MRLLLLLALLAVASGCAQPNYGESRPGLMLLTAGPQPGYGIKQVVQKDSSLTLVADDGSVCRTSSARYSSTSEGSWIACLWSLPPR
jgi:hypothetical protein